MTAISRSGQPSPGVPAAFRTTSHQVAERAGVSRSTVSLVLAGKDPGRVSAQVRERVLQVAHDLGYRPNAAAGQLRSGRSRTLALIAFAPGTDPQRLPRSSSLFGAELAARHRGYALTVSTVHSDGPWTKIVDALNSWQVDGAMFPGLPGVMPTLERFSGRIVILGPSFGRTASLDVDHVGGARLAIETLRAGGHQRIGYLWPALDSGRRRAAAFHRLMEQAGIDPQPLVRQCRWSVDDARLAALSLLRLPAPPTAILCDDDVLAAGVYRAARLLGRRIPEDLSVLAFADDRAPNLLDPELATVALPLFDAGQRAATILMDQLEGVPPPPHVVLPVSLRPAASLAPAPLVDRA